MCWIDSEFWIWYTWLALVLWRFKLPLMDALFHSLNRWEWGFFNGMEWFFAVRIFTAIQTLSKSFWSYISLLFRNYPWYSTQRSRIVPMVFLSGRIGIPLERHQVSKEGGKPLASIIELHSEDKTSLFSNVYPLVIDFECWSSSNLSYHLLKKYTGSGTMRIVVPWSPNFGGSCVYTILYFGIVPLPICDLRSLSCAGPRHCFQCNSTASDHWAKFCGICSITLILA